MENQHRQITGYRELTQEEIDAMNAVKIVAEGVGKMLEEFDVKDVDKRWLAIARSQLQQGFMALTRSIAKPTSF